MVRRSIVSLLQRPRIFGLTPFDQLAISCGGNDNSLQQPALGDVTALVEQ